MTIIQLQRLIIFLVCIFHLLLLIGNQYALYICSRFPVTFHVVVLNYSVYIIIFITIFILQWTILFIYLAALSGILVPRILVCRILVPWPGIEPGPWQWKHRVLATRPPRWPQWPIFKLLPHWTQNITKGNFKSANSTNINFIKWYSKMFSKINYDILIECKLKQTDWSSPCKIFTTLRI